MNVDTIKKLYSTMGKSTGCDSDEEMLARKDELEIRIIGSILQSVSCNRKIVGVWNGDFDNGRAKLQISGPYHIIECLNEILFTDHNE